MTKTKILTVQPAKGSLSTATWQIRTRPFANRRSRVLAKLPSECLLAAPSPALRLLRFDFLPLAFASARRFVPLATLPVGSSPSSSSSSPALSDLCLPETTRHIALQHVVDPLGNAINWEGEKKCDGENREKELENMEHERRNKVGVDEMMVCLSDSDYISFVVWPCLR